MSGVTLNAWDLEVLATIFPVPDTGDFDWVRAFFFDFDTDIGRLSYFWRSMSKRRRRRLRGRIKAGLRVALPEIPPITFESLTDRRLTPFVAPIIR